MRLTMQVGSHPMVISAVAAVERPVRATVAFIFCDALGAGCYAGWLHGGADLAKRWPGLQRLGVRLEFTQAVLNHLSGSRAGIVAFTKGTIGQRRNGIRDWKSAHSPGPEVGPAVLTATGGGDEQMFGAE